MFFGKLIKEVGIQVIGTFVFQLIITLIPATRPYWREFLLVIVSALITYLFIKVNKLEHNLFEFTSKEEITEKMKVKLEDFDFKNSAYWKKINSDGPFCSRCLEKDKETIRIIPNSPGSNYATCPECDNQVNYTGKEEPVFIGVRHDSFE